LGNISISQADVLAGSGEISAFQSGDADWQWANIFILKQ
jgi:hypothetical protein